VIIGLKILNRVEGVTKNIIEKINICAPCSNLECNNMFQAPLSFSFCNEKVIGNLLMLELFLCQQTSNVSSF